MPTDLFAAQKAPSSRMSPEEQNAAIRDIYLLKNDGPKDLFAGRAPRDLFASRQPVDLLAPKEESAVAQIGARESRYLQKAGAGIKEALTKPLEEKGGPVARIGEVGGRAADVAGNIFGAAVSPLSAVAAQGLKPLAKPLATYVAEKSGGATPEEAKQIGAKLEGETADVIGASLASAAAGMGGVKAPRIASAAKLSDAGEVATGAKHADIPSGGKEGFVTEEGKFVGREEADKLAKANEQLVQPEITPGKLHSEDIGQPKPQSKIFSPDQPVASTQPASSTKGLHDLLTQQQQGASLDMKEAANWMKPLRGAVPEATWEKFLDHADDPKGIPLTPEESKLYDNTIGVMKQEIDQNRVEIKGAGLNPNRLEGTEDEGSLGGAIRVSKQHETPLSRMLGEERAPVSGKSLSKSAGTFKGRSMMNADIDGKRTVVHVNDNDEVIDAANGKKLGTYNEDSDDVALLNNKTTKLTEATRKEIEAATEGRVSYEKNALGVYMTTLLNTRRAVRSARLLDEIKKSPDFNQVARRPFTKGETPYITTKYGKKLYWREVPGIPGFKGYKFHPHIAEELEDFTHGLDVSLGELNTLDRLNRFSLNLFFFANPYHDFNLTQIALTTRTGGKLAGFDKDFAEAAKDVMLLRKPYTQMARAGVPLPGLYNAGEAFRKATLEAMGVEIRRNPLAFRVIFKELLGDEASNMKPGEMYDFISDASRQATQSYQDILQLALMKGEMRKGLNMAQARERIAKTFPSDSPQARVLGSRVLGHIMHTQAFLNFPHYFYNRIKGASNVLKGLKGPERVRAAKQLAAVALTYEMGKQVYTPILQYLTGNPNAQSGGFGYDVFPEAGERLYSGMTGGDYGRTAGQTFQALASEGYVPQAYDLARGIEPYFGKQISTVGESFPEILSDYASEAAYKLSPVQRAIGIQQGRMSPTDLMWQQALGVKFPSNPAESRGANRALRTREKYGTAADNLYQQISDYLTGKTP